MNICLHVYVYYAWCHKGQNMVSDLLELELRTTIMWELGTKPWSFVRAASECSSPASHLSSPIFFFQFLCCIWYKGTALHRPGIFCKEWNCGIPIWSCYRKGIKGQSTCSINSCQLSKRVRVTLTHESVLWWPPQCQSLTWSLWVRICVLESQRKYGFRTQIL